MCVCTHVSACEHVFIRARDYAEHCCRQEERKKSGGGGGKSCVVSLITKQTTAGPLPCRINAYVFL